MQTLDSYIAELQSITMEMREILESFNSPVTRLEQNTQELRDMSAADNLIAAQFEKAMLKANPPITPLPIEE